MAMTTWIAWIALFLAAVALGLAIWALCKAWDD